ncbi:hypothetical protein C0991_001304 [Blastosporella zonata]|nr:hypothetical protein C0991_001304 [Blastosporella zonata]
MPQVMDLVDWANSQPVGLKSLLSEAAKKPEKRPLQYEATWSTSDKSSIQEASTSRGPLQARYRPLRRTTSSSSARLGPGAHSEDPPPLPDVELWSKDRVAVLRACQSVSMRMDENAFTIAEQLDSGPSKRKPKASCLVKRSRRATTEPRSIAHGRDGVTRWDKGKQSANLLPESKPLGTNFQRSVSTPLIPDMEARPQRSAAPSSTNSSRRITSEVANDWMMDLDPYDKPPTPSPFIAPPTEWSPAASTRSISTSSNSSFSTDASSIVIPSPKIQLHPLLTQKRLPQQAHGPIKQTSPVTRHHPAPLPLNPPPLSQSTRPPTLGMRRAHTAPVPAQHALPTRRKAFKPPLLSQAAPTPALRAMVSIKNEGRGRYTNEPSRSPSPYMNTDADSSFGDISFGMDEEALELTMRQYD